MFNVIWPLAFAGLNFILFVLPIDRERVEVEVVSYGTLVKIVYSLRTFQTFLYVDQRGRWHLFLTTHAKFSACLLVNFDQLESFLVSNLTLDLTLDL